MGFAEDVEVLPNGEYVVSESIFGGLWLIGRDGKIRRGLVPDDGGAAAAQPRPVPVPGRWLGHGRRPAVRRRAAGSRPAPARSPCATRSSTSARPARAASSALAIRTLLDTSKPADRARGEDHHRLAAQERPREPEGDHVQPLGRGRPVDLRRRPVPADADPHQLAHRQARGALRRRTSCSTSRSRRRSCRRCGTAGPTRW